MKTLKGNQQGFGIVELVIVLVVVSILGGVGFFVYQKRIKTGNVKITTECFSISVPDEFIIESTSNACKFSAKSGDNIILMTPFTDKVNNKEEAVASLEKMSPGLTDEETAKVKVGKYDAEVFGGYGNASDNAPKKQLATYAVYGIDPYTPSGGDHTVNAFLISFILDPNEDTNTKVREIVRSITWN